MNRATQRIVALAAGGTGGHLVPAQELKVAVLKGYTPKFKRRKKGK